MTSNDSTSDAVVIERTFDAPVDLVWKMWTEPEHFQAWYGPEGAKILISTMDVRVGGIRLVGMEMETPNGAMQMWFVGEYREVVENRRLIYTESMCDEHGNVSPPEMTGMAAGHPTTTEVHVELDDVGGRAHMVLTHRGIPSDSPGAAGWAMAFDKLVVHLAAQSRR